MFKEQVGWNIEVYVEDLLLKSKKSDEHTADLRETFVVLRETYMVSRKYKIRLNPIKCAFGVESGKFLGFMVSERGIDANPEKIQAIVNIKPPKNLMRFRSWWEESQRLTGSFPGQQTSAYRFSECCAKCIIGMRSAMKDSLNSKNTSLIPPLEPNRAGRNILPVFVHHTGSHLGSISTIGKWNSKISLLHQPCTYRGRN